MSTSFYVACVKCLKQNATEVVEALETGVKVDHVHRDEDYGIVAHTSWGGDVEGRRVSWHVHPLIPDPQTVLISEYDELTTVAALEASRGMGRKTDGTA